MVTPPSVVHLHAENSVHCHGNRDLHKNLENGENLQTIEAETGKGDPAQKAQEEILRLCH